MAKARKRNARQRVRSDDSCTDKFMLESGRTEKRIVRVSRTNPRGNANRPTSRAIKILEIRSRAISDDRLLITSRLTPMTRRRVRVQLVQVISPEEFYE